MTENEISARVVDICFRIHTQYGPGMFENVYEELFCHELAKTGIPFKRQCGIGLVHDAVRMNLAFRADLIIDNKVIIELKSVETVLPVHKKQVLTYLKLTGIKLGMLLNFNSYLMKDGINRIVNKL